MSDRPLEEGVLFAGKYRVVRCLARGGMGVVYEAIHTDTNRRRALKVMHPHILHSDDLRERFRREASIASGIESEFIVDVFDTGVDEASGAPFLCMELLRGEELARRLKKWGRIPPEDVALFMHQTALALDRTHQAGVVHRDLKPENLFITQREDGPERIKVLDFGIAKVIADGMNSGPATLSIGTPIYMSPEQFTPHARVSGASDVYALGMIAYTCLAGAAYWDEEARCGNIFAFGAIVTRGVPEAASARALRRDVKLPKGFDAWFAKATSLAPGERFSPATAATRALAEVLGYPIGGGARVEAAPVAPSGEVPLTPEGVPQLYPDEEVKTLVIAQRSSVEQVVAQLVASRPPAEAALGPIDPNDARPVGSGTMPMLNAAAALPRAPMSSVTNETLTRIAPHPAGGSPVAPLAQSALTPHGTYTPSGAVLPGAGMPAPSIAPPLPGPPPFEAASFGGAPAQAGSPGRGRLVALGGAVVFAAVVIGALVGRARSSDEEAPAGAAAAEVVSPVSGATIAPAATDPAATATATASAGATGAPSEAPAASAVDPATSSEAPAASASSSGSSAGSAKVAAPPASSVKPSGKKNPLRTKYSQE